MSVCLSTGSDLWRPFVYRWGNLRHLNWCRQCLAMPLLPQCPSALVRRCRAAGQRDTRHDSCRLYATWNWHFRQRFMLWSNASNGRAATITLLEVRVSSRYNSVHPCQKWVLRRTIYTAAHQLCAVRAEGKILQCLRSLLWRVAVLSVCLRCFLSLDEAVWQQATTHCC